MSKEENDAIYASLTALRIGAPFSYARARVCAKWDDLNRIYDRFGINDDFKEKRKALKQTIRQFAEYIDLKELAEYKPDIVVVVDEKRNIVKRSHGYNLNYAPVSA